MQRTFMSVSERRMNKLLGDVREKRERNARKCEEMREKMQGKCKEMPSARGAYSPSCAGHDAIRDAIVGEPTDGLMRITR